MRNIKLTIEYDGTEFVGWQIQKEGRTVQGVLREILIKLTSEEINLIGAGRTDSGVHARGQVANFLTNSDRKIETIYRALNDLLPEDIRIHEVAETELGFNARYDAIERTYRYFISLIPLAINRNFYLYCYYKIDFDLLYRCSEHIKSITNFKSFCFSRSEVKHHNCKIMNALWIKENNILIFEISANRFLHGMVRSLVGTMIDVGRGYISFNDFTELIEKQDRRSATKCAPPHGLCLEKIRYESAPKSPKTRNCEH